MLIRRLGVSTLSFLAVLLVLVLPVSSETGDKQLARVKGVVGYQIGDTGDFKAIFGRLDLPDDAYAVTKPNGAAVLRLKDSSEIDIGENTKVQVGAFNAVSSGQQNLIVLQNGALHFNIRHPEGGQSNYKFVTATSQIAVRGTEGFLIAGTAGTQVVCVSCATGDVTVQVGTQTFSVLSGQTLTVVGSTALTAASNLAPNASINNAAINQFNNGTNPFNPNPSGSTFDPTNSYSGTGTGTGGAGAAGISGGTIAGVAGGAVAAGVAIAATNHGSSPPPPTPMPTATPVPPPGPLLIQISYPGASNTFPVPFTWPFSQTNATSNATVSCTGNITCTVQQAFSGTTLNGAVTGNIGGPGTFSVTAAASGYMAGPSPFNIYSGVSAGVTSLNFTSLTPQTITVSQNPTGTMLHLTQSCAAGAGMTVAPTSGVSPLTVTVTPVSPPTASGTTACTLTITGAGGTAASTTTIPVNITTTSIGVSSKVRKPL